MELSDILHNLKIQELTPMQEAAKEAYQSAKDLVLLSPTGSGKTLAFLLPLVQTLKADIQGVQALVLVPSRELALQIETVFKSMGTPFKAMSCYRHSRTYERPFAEAELRYPLCNHIGDR